MSSKIIETEVAMDETGFTACRKPIQDAVWIAEASR
jgi:hypothetical protein